ncbi:MAG: hypothetical protein DI604_23985 [Delftia acidovorans]|nr:MAG: hypothetical protein DI604_23985 [Delftia acidovorans]
MTGIFWSAGEASVKTFSSASKGGSKGTETILKVELSVSDHYALGSLLEQLTEIARNQTREAAAAKDEKTAKRSKPLALPAPALRIMDMREDRE